MAIIKCKMCGGDLNIVEGESVCECEYCGTRQTIPSADNEKKLTLFARANRLRLSSEFDKAFGIYESIVADFPEEAEAYWGLVLCKYGIEYVDDPATGKKIPTCHRSSFESVLKDSDFEQACENADGIARRVYRDEAKQIEEIRKGILEVSGKEDPYDIFICYKETNENGDRTLDSVLAQDIYDALTDKGYRVFFSRITLEDKLGQEYEPYIFAALNSAKIMLAVGTDYEYYNAVWVKNEWSRYLKLMAKDKEKHLIPCFKGIDAYDMPEEFAKLQAQDLGKVGAMQDLLRGIDKLLPREKAESQKILVTESNGNNHLNSLLDRGNMALEDKKWKDADKFFEEVLNQDSRCGQAYLGKLLAQEEVSTIDGLVGARLSKIREKGAEKLSIPIDKNYIEGICEKYILKNFLEQKRIEELFKFEEIYFSRVEGMRQQHAEEAIYWQKNRFVVRIKQFSQPDLIEKLDTAINAILEKLHERIQTAIKEEQINRSKAEKIYRDRLASAVLSVKELRHQAEVELEKSYSLYCSVLKDSTVPGALRSAAQMFEQYGDYKDSRMKVQECLQRADELEKAEKEKNAEKARIEAEKRKEEQEALEIRQRQELQKKTRKKRTKKIVIIAAVLLVIAVAAVKLVVIPEIQYKKAEALLTSGQKEKAIAEFEKLGKEDRISEIYYSDAEEFMSSGQYEDAIEAFLALGDYSDSATRALEAQYAQAQEYLQNGKKEDAAIAFGKAIGYKDAKGKSFALWAEIGNRSIISGDLADLSAVCEDGTVLETGRDYYHKCEFQGSRYVMAVENAFGYSAFLTNEGRVAIYGKTQYGEDKAVYLENIVDIAAGDDFLLGLYADGTIVKTTPTAAQLYSDISDVIDVCSGGHYIVLLHSDGTVSAYSGKECDQEVKSWRNIKAISASRYHIVGLREDGSVVSTSMENTEYSVNQKGQDAVSGWSDIVKIAASDDFTVGLRRDGTLVETINAQKPNETHIDKNWINIVDVYVVNNCVFGIKQDGSIVKNSECDYDISGWNNVKSCTNLEMDSKN